jgi:hypothetical protein
MLVRAFAGDEALPLGPVLGVLCPLGVAKWQAKGLEPPLQKPAVAHLLPELWPRLADPRREEVPREEALVHVPHVTYPLQGSAPHVVAQIPNSDALPLLQLNRGDAAHPSPTAASQWQTVPGAAPKATGAS